MSAASYTQLSFILDLGAEANDYVQRLAEEIDKPTEYIGNYSKEALELADRYDLEETLGTGVWISKNRTGMAFGSSPMRTRRSISS